MQHTTIHIYQILQYIRVLNGLMLIGFQTQLMEKTLKLQ